MLNDFSINNDEMYHTMIGCQMAATKTVEISTPRVTNARENSPLHPSDPSEKKMPSYELGISRFEL